MKPNTKKAARRAFKPHGPDEVYTLGPIKVARFGKNVVWKSDWAEGDFDRMQQQLAQGYDEVVQKLDELVARIADLVASLPPLKILHRAWGERSVAYMGIDNEFDAKSEQVLATRMLDYVQSIVAGIPQAEELKTELSEEDWAQLTDTVR